MAGRIMWVIVAILAFGGASAFALSGSGESESGSLDTVSPRLAAVTAGPASLSAAFSEPMLAPGVITMQNYAISGQGTGSLAVHPTGVSDPAPYLLTWSTGEMRHGATITLTASGVQDVAGNPIDPAFSSAATPGMGVSPEFTGLAVHPPQAVAGDTVTISFTASEPLGANPIVTVNGHNASHVSGGSSYVYSYTILAGNPPGAATVAVTGYDLAANVGALSNDSALEIIEHEHGLPLRAWPLAVAVLIAALAARARRRAIAALMLPMALLASSPAMAASPAVSEVAFSQTATGGTTTVDISYNLVAPNGPCAITVSLSKDGGADGYPFPVTHCTGDIANVTTGTGRHIVWDIRADYPEESIPNARIRVTATDAYIPPAAFGWTRTWSGGNANAARVAVDTSGNIYVAGDYSGTVDFDPDPVNIQAHSSANGTLDAFLSKFDASGNLLWVKTWGSGSGRDVAYGVAVDSAGDAYVVGPYRWQVDFNPDPVLEDTHTSNFDGENNIYVSKFAADGTFQWVRAWGPSRVIGKGSFGAEAYTVAVSGNYLYVVGDFSGDQTDFCPWGTADWHVNHSDPGPILWFDSFLSKFDLNGNLLWAKTWGGEGYDDGPGVAVDGAGNVYVAGMYASQNINFDPDGGPGGLGHPAHDSGSVVDVFLSKFDADGHFQWVKTWGGQGTEDAMGLVAVDPANNVYVAGRFASQDCDFNPGGTPSIHSANNLLDAFLTKFDANGEFHWAKTWGGNGNDDARGLAVDGSGNVYVTGVFTDVVDFDPSDAGIDNQSATELVAKDPYFSKFTSNGDYQWVKTWGGSGDDTGGVTVDGADNAYAFGSFMGSADFDPGSNVDTHTAVGTTGAYLTKFISICR